MKRSRAWPFEVILGAAVAGVVILAAAGSLMTGRLADFPAWLEAIATAAAFVAAVFAARYAVRAFELESARDERWLAERRGAQAELVAAWPGGFNWEVASSQVDGYDVPGAIDAVQISIQNASAVPVTNVWVDATLVVALPSGPIRLDLGRQLVSRMLPHTENPQARWLQVKSAINPASYLPDDVDRTDPDYWCEVAVYFRDAGGRDWERLPDGRLLLVNGE